MIRIAAVELREFAKNILLGVHVPPAKANLIATTLVASNLRGVDSHGVQLLLFYLDQIEAGNFDVNAGGHVISESGACLLYDGENGLGQPVSEICCGHLIRLAKEHGVAAVVARESNHFGAAAYWARQIAAAGMIGIVGCNASPMVAPWQGKDARFGTNPLCMAVPGDAWLLDMATTTVAMGKIYKASLSGQPQIPAGWAMDAEGVPTTATETAMSGLLMPLGGYKGSGLAMMAEILCAVLGGGAMSTELGRIRDQSKPTRVSHFFLAIDAGRFGSPDEFRARMETLVTVVKSSRPAAGYEEVLVAGEPELRAESERSRNGIPLDEGVWNSLIAAATRLGVKP